LCPTFKAGLLERVSCRVRPAGSFEQRIGDRMTQELQFLVKAISPDGYVGWLTSPANGFRTISMRAGAAVFSTHDQATLAIARLSPTLGKGGIRFFVEPDQQAAAGTSS